MKFKYIQNILSIHSRLTGLCRAYADPHYIIISYFPLEDSEIQIYIVKDIPVLILEFHLLFNLHWNLILNVGQHVQLNISQVNLPFLQVSFSIFFFSQTCKYKLTLTKLAMVVTKSQEKNQEELFLRDCLIPVTFCNVCSLVFILQLTFHSFQMVDRKTFWIKSPSHIKHFLSFFFSQKFSNLVLLIISLPISSFIASLSTKQKLLLLKITEFSLCLLLRCRRYPFILSLVISTQFFSFSPMLPFYLFLSILSSSFIFFLLISYSSSS